MDPSLMYRYRAPYLVLNGYASRFYRFLTSSRIIMKGVADIKTISPYAPIYANDSPLSSIRILFVVYTEVDSYDPISPLM